MTIWALCRSWGLQESEIWDLTPGRYHELYRVYRARQKREDWRSAMIAQTIANMVAAAVGSEQRYEIATFLPEDLEPEEAAQHSPEELLRRVEILNQLFGGKDLRGKREQRQRTR